MSRSRRRSPLIGKSTHPAYVKQDVEKHRAFVMRAGKRALIRQGIIMDPATRPEKYEFTWEYGDQMGTVYADTKSEGRALIKKALGIKNKRLPTGVRIVRSPNIALVKAGEAAHANLRRVFVPDSAV